MPFRPPRWLVALSAAALLAPAAALAKKEGESPGRGHGPPESRLPAGAPARPPADRPAKPVRQEPADTPVPGVSALGEDAPAELPAPEPIEGDPTTRLPETEPPPVGEAACSPAGEPVAPARVKRDRGRSNRVTYVVRGVVRCTDEDSVVIRVTGGNRRAASLVGTEVSVAPGRVVVNDEAATVADVWVEDRVIFQLRASRGEALGIELAPKRLVVQTWREPVEELPAAELPPVDEPILEQ